MSLIKQVKTNIIKSNCITNNNKLLVAVSSGPDSMCLIDMLLKIKDEFCLDLYVAHVNHMLRQESKEEKEYIIKYCKDKNLKLFVKDIDVNKISIENKTGIEETARNERYSFFYNILKKEKLDKIVIAHNLNDNVETVLLNIIRGCSIKGLNGMDYIKHDIIRPLIEIQKDDIIEYCDKNSIKYYIDQSNYDNNYARNKVRNELLPLLKNEYNDNIIQNISRLSYLSRLDEDFLNDYVVNFVEKNIIEMKLEYIIYNYETLLKEKKTIQLRCIRQIINLVICDLNGISNIHVVDILKLLKNNIKGKQYCIGNKFTIEVISKYMIKIERV